MGAASPITAFLLRRRRPLLASAAGLLGGCAAKAGGLLGGVSVLAGWNLAAAVYVGSTGFILLFSDHQALRARAKEADEDRFVLSSIVLAAVLVSLGAIVLALKESKSHAGGGGVPPWVLALATSTLILSWLTVQCLYALHYAHRYFGDRDGDGEPDGGIVFPGGPPSTYRDFIYVTVCIGATCQVSDFNITATNYRSLVTTHALISFLFNTMVLALGINIIGNLMGQ